MSFISPPTGMTVQQFQQTWRNSSLTERSAAQQHFLGLCRLLGMLTPAEVDQEGSFYTFEKGERKTARELSALRENWLNPPGASEDVLKKRTLTNLYNARPAWLQHARAKLDRAVWAAYGWDDPDPAAVPEEDILSRLLALNQERSTGVA